MAKAKSSAKCKSIAREEVELKLRHIARDVEQVECTAVCVEMALLERMSDRDREIAICVERNIANMLGRISRDIAALMAAHGWEYTPLLRSPLLGLRFRPASDEVTRKSDPSPKR